MAPHAADKKQSHSGKMIKKKNEPKKSLFIFRAIITNVFFPFAKVEHVWTIGL